MPFTYIVDSMMVKVNLKYETTARVGTHNKYNIWYPQLYGYLYELLESSTTFFVLFFLVFQLIWFIENGYRLKLTWVPLNIANFYIYLKRKRNNLKLDFFEIVLCRILKSFIWDLKVRFPFVCLLSIIANYSSSFQWVHFNNPTTSKNAKNI